jgi:alpha-L-arabinofuranosidase
VEGKYLDNGYNWKNTIGELYERKSDYNLWSEDMPTGSYNQSYQIGFYEYFCLCEDIGAKPLPTLNVGLACQIRSMQRGEATCPNIPVDSPGFQTVIDSYLDLIEFATGDPDKSGWAAKRAAMGHPEPFVLDRIGIGNEQYADTYYERYRIIEKAIHDQYPDMICIFCAGVHPFNIEVMGAPGLGRVYEEARKYKNILVDEHSYHSTDWFEQMSTRFDEYDREGPGVFFGEYSANGLLGPIGNPTNPEEASALMKAMAEEALGSDEDMVVSSTQTAAGGSNQYKTALAEAAFLTGVERNSDIVIQTSYAPLYNLAECDQWMHNLIDFNPKTVAYTSNYYVQKLFSNYLGTEYVGFDDKLPEHVFASVTEDEGAYYLKLVNTGDLEDEAQIAFPQAISGAAGEIMQSNDLTLRNGLRFYGETDYQIVPEKVSAAVEGNCVKAAVKAHSVLVLKISK